jgi:glucose dehydrogenase
MRHGSWLSKTVALPLQTSPVEAVEVKRLALVLVVVAALSYVGGTVLTPSPVIASQSQPQVVATSRDAGHDGDLDAYGNEITSAVAEYSLDPAGSLYELHAPQIEIPRLGSPKS